MIVRLAWLATVLGLCGLLVLLAISAYAGANRPTVYACPAEYVADADGCPTHGPAGYDEGRVVAMQTEWPTRFVVCAELWRLCH